MCGTARSGGRPWKRSRRRAAAGPLGATVQSVLIGRGSRRWAAEVASYGADRVHVFDDAELAHYASESFARALAQVITEEKPAAVLIPYTAMGKDVAPRVSARVGAGLVSDVVKLEVNAGRLEARRPVYAGKALATVRWEGEPQMATLRPQRVRAGHAGGGAQVRHGQRAPPT